MDFTDVIKARRSIRKYKRDPIPEDVYQRLYESLSLAPTGGNQQPYHFIFVNDEKTRWKIVSDGCHQEYFFDAPLLVVACCEPGKEFDVAIAMDHLILAATNEGLGTCWAGGGIVMEEFRKILGVPQKMHTPIFTPVGYPAESPDAKPRKPLNKLISIDAYK